MAETPDESQTPNGAKGRRADGAPRQKPITGAQKRAVAEDKARRAKRRRAGKTRYG